MLEPDSVTTPVPELSITSAFEDEPVITLEIKISPAASALTVLLIVLANANVIVLFPEPTALRISNSKPDVLRIITFEMAPIVPPFNVNVPFTVDELFPILNELSTRDELMSIAPTA